MLSQQEELNIVPAGHKLCWHLGVLSQFRNEQRDLSHVVLCQGGGSGLASLL